MLATTRTVIVDEIHALAGSKRGSHLALSLERLASLTTKPPVRIGLSATQKPIDEIARFLVGVPARGEQADEGAAMRDRRHRPYPHARPGPRRAPVAARSRDVA